MENNDEISDSTDSYFVLICFVTIPSVSLTVLSIFE